MTRTKRALDVYVEVIDERMGMEAWVVSSNAIAFHPTAGRLMVIEVDDADPAFLCLWTYLPGETLPVTGEALHTLCAKAQKRKGLRGVKCTVDDDGDAVFSVEKLVAIPDTVPTVYYLLHVLPWAIRKLTAGIELVILDSFAEVVGDETGHAAEEP